MQAGAARLGVWRGWGQDFALATALALFLAVIGPFGSYLNGPLWQRLVFQFPNCFLAVALIGAGVRAVAMRWPWGPALWVATAAIALLVMLPITLVNILMAAWLWPFVAKHMTPALWYGEGLLIALPASFGFVWLALRRAERADLAAEAKADAARPAPGLLGAHPQDVLCLQMEDHYVRVHTAAGSRLVLATLSQAIEALDGAPGLRVHRSWWVAQAAVVRGEHEGRNVRLLLSDGLVAPVARSSVAEVRARGWL